KSSDTFNTHKGIEERAMDSNDQERERGITIYAKNASITHKGGKFNIVDTPGHADFGSEVERVLRTVDAVILVVDAYEGPMPQTKFVLRKALELGHSAVVVINKIDRPDAQIEDVVNRTFVLFVDLGAKDTQLDFPIVYASGIQGTATRDMKHPGTHLDALFEAIIEKVPAPDVFEGDHLQMLVLALVADAYKGKMGIGKILRGSVKKGMNIVGMHRDGQQTSGKATSILSFKGLEREEIESAEAGEIVAIAGLPEIGIGDTIADALQPEALPVVSVEEPTVQMTFGVNTSPFAGQDGKFVTSRNLRDRLTKELETNVALRMHSDESSNQFLVS
ncbi:MAG: GTP-binding protein, partial [Anaerolineales bacterium]|nr:GTP-binding protein [Anaerolineales bacterium]